jgi:hypothetical protein
MTEKLVFLALWLLMMLFQIAAGFKAVADKIKALIDRLIGDDDE